MSFFFKRTRITKTPKTELLVLQKSQFLPKTLKTMSSFTNATNLDNLLLQTLMDRLQIRPPQRRRPPLLTQSLEDLLLDAAANLSDSDSDSDENRTQLSREESKLEKEIIRVIRSGNTEFLNPNSGQTVTVNDHHICVSFHEEKGSVYRVWEWHGHIMLLDEESGYSPEYIYGNYFERLQPGGAWNAVQEDEDDEDDKEDEEEKEEEKEQKVGSSGLRELIEDGGKSDGCHVLHRNITTSSPRF